MRVLVTGGGGFIGSHVADRLLALGHEVRIVDNFATGHRANVAHLEADVEVVEADIRDLDTLRGVVRGCEAVVHLAAIPSVAPSIADPITTHQVNVTGTLNVLVAARDEEASRVVFASSSSLYGAGVELPKGESLTPLPISPFAVSKLAAESYCRSFFEVHGLETVALRYFNVFGPRQDSRSEYSAVIPRFIWALRNGEPPVVFGDGEQSRDFTYVEDVVEATILAVDRPGIGGRVYDVGCGRSVTVNQLVNTLRHETGSPINAVYGPEEIGKARHSVADITSARMDLGYEPAVAFEEGIRRTVDHHASTDEAERRPPVIRPINQRPARAVPHAPKAAAGSHRRSSYLITGGAGFIGSHLVEALVAREQAERIVILDDLSTGRLANIEHLLAGEQVSFVQGSVNDAPLVDELMRDTDTCVHLASAVGVQMIIEEPLDTLMQSVRGSNVVMHAASRYDVRVLFCSTSEVYGKHNNGALSEQDDLIFGSPSKGRWTYGIAKSFGEALIHAYHRQRGTDATIVRPFNTVGPRQSANYGMVLPRFVRQALDGESLTVYGSGAQTRCFTHVRDTVSALVALSQSDRAQGRTFNIGSSTPIAIVELARRVIEHTESDSEILLVPYEEAYGDGFEELGSRRPDTTALRTLTGWQPHATVDDAIVDVIAYERGTVRASAAERVA